jgi:hypothetical protein
MAGTLASQSDMPSQFALGAGLSSKRLKQVDLDDLESGS